MFTFFFFCSKIFLNNFFLPHALEASNFDFTFLPFDSQKALQLLKEKNLCQRLLKPFSAKRLSLTPLVRSTLNKQI